MIKRIESPLLKVLSLLVMLTIVLGGFSPALPASAAEKQSADPGGLMFVENVGQFGQSARFQAAAGSGTLWLAEDALWISLVSALPASEGKPASVQIANVKISFEGANPSPELEPFNRLNTVVSYFRGDDPAKWQANVPVWGGVRYLDIYPGIDLEISSEQGVYTQRLVALPGADLSAVKINIEGVDSLQVNGDQILLSTPLGKIGFPLLQVSQTSQTRLPAPELAGKQVNHPFAQSRSGIEIAGQFAGAADLLYSTFLGGADNDEASGVAVDANDSVYIVGYTGSNDFPTTPGVIKPAHTGNDNVDAFIAKFTAAGEAVYLTYLGSGGNDVAHDVSVDASGNAYVTGGTTIGNSINFPVTTGAFDTTTDTNISAPYDDAFAIILNSTGTGLLYGTFLGIDGKHDSGYQITNDTSGDMYVAGYTEASDFPTSTGAFDRTLNGNSDGFMVKLSPDGNGANDLVYSTFIGGSSGENMNGLAIDGTGAAYIAGTTSSADFPVTPGAFDGSMGGEYDGFIVKVNPAGSALDYGTYLGGSSYSDSPNDIAVDSTGAAYVTGYNLSTDFPTTEGAFDRGLDSNGDAFVTKLNPSGSTLDYSTYIGGTDGWESGSSIMVDSSGAAFVSGITASTNFPTTCGAFDNTFNGSGSYYMGDSFFVKVNPAGSALLYSTYLGGSEDDDDNEGNNVYFDSDGNAVVAGTTRSADFPVTAGAFDTTLNGSNTFDVFLAKLDMHASTITPPTLASPASGKKTNDKTPTFTWNAVEAGYQYRLQISRNNTFSTLVRNALVLPGKLTFTTTALNDGQYYWRVAAYDAGKNMSTWSNTRTFTVDTVKPAAPQLTAPANNATIQGIPTYMWKAVTGAKFYQVSRATNSTFTSGVVNSPWLTVLQYKPASQPKGTYWWRVRAKDAAGNIGPWSAVRTVILK